MNVSPDTLVRFTKLALITQVTLGEKLGREPSRAEMWWAMRAYAERVYPDLPAWRHREVAAKVLDIVDAAEECC